MIDANEARRIFSYDELTGCISWKVSLCRRIPNGSIAGHIHKNGYRRVMYKAKPYYSHRIAWLIHYGNWPEYNIDHIDGNKLNNKISNLRDVDQSENTKNSKKCINNTSGVTGVYWRKYRNHWSVYINDNRRLVFLGNYKTIFNAAATRISAQNKYGYSKNHGR